MYTHSSIHLIQLTAQTAHCEPPEHTPQSHLVHSIHYCWLLDHPVVWLEPPLSTHQQQRKHIHVAVLMLLVLDVNGVVVEGRCIQVATWLQGGAGTPSGWVFQAGVLGCAGGDTW